MFLLHANIERDFYVVFQVVRSIKNNSHECVGKAISFFFTVHAIDFNSVKACQFFIFQLKLKLTDEKSSHKSTNRMRNSAPKRKVKGVDSPIDQVDKIDKINIP